MLVGWFFVLEFRKLGTFDVASGMTVVQLFPLFDVARRSRCTSKCRNNGNNVRLQCLLAQRVLLVKRMDDAYGVFQENI